VASAVAQSGQAARQQTPVFKGGTELIRLEVRAWDKDHKFIPGLGPKDFRILEDGVLQTIQAFSASVGGRMVADPLRPAGAPNNGLVLPPQAPRRDASGRIFIVFIDDLHLQPGDTPRVRQWLRDVRDILIHDNDLVGFVSSGYSSIQGQVGYDPKHRRFNDVIERVMGAASTPGQIVAGTTTSAGPAGLQYAVGVAFRTVYGLLEQMAPITDRTKVLIYVSSGYDLNPYKDSRYREAQAKYSTKPEGVGGAPPGLELNDPAYLNPFARTGQWNETELVAQIAELVNAAVRTNTTFYPMDPRGLVAAIPDIGEPVSAQEWRESVNTQQSTLRVLADETNGICICNVNDPRPMLRQIDNATSDFYLIGYVSTNPDPRQRRRKIEITVARPEVRELGYAKEYVIQSAKR
jgi:VWFA-related protein